MSLYLQWKLLQKVGQKATAADINVLYNKSGLFAINKPYGIAVHHGPKVKRSIAGLFPELEEMYGMPSNSLALANRLDKNVSGVLLLTYDNEMASKIADLYKRRMVQKKYLAILVGSAKAKKGSLSGSFSETLTGNQYKQVVTQDSEDVQTHFKVIDKNRKTCMLCALEASSGNKHQLRAHLSQILNCPILGDHKYHKGDAGPQRIPLRLMQMMGMTGVQKTNPESNKKYSGKIQPWQRGLVPLHLFAQHVRLPGLDSDGADIKINAPIPDYFTQTMEDCSLMFNRAEYEEQMMNDKKQRKSRGELRESIFVPKGIYPSNIGQ